MMSSISVVSKTHGHDALVFFSVGIIEDPPPEDPSKRRRRSSQARDWVEGGATGEEYYIRPGARARARARLWLGLGLGYG